MVESEVVGIAKLPVVKINQNQKILLNIFEILFLGVSLNFGNMTPVTF